MKLDSGVAYRAGNDRQGDALEQLKIDMDIEPLGLKGGPPFFTPIGTPGVSSASSDTPSSKSLNCVNLKISNIFG